MSPVATGATRDRSILGIMVDFAKAVPYHLEPAYSDDTSLALVEDRLAETPCYPGRSFGSSRVPREEGPGAPTREMGWLTKRWRRRPSAACASAGVPRSVVSCLARRGSTPNRWRRGGDA